ncbi:hypothetical protein F7725_024246 [Dissostichus mawsoni]|uniref:Uncharacterized protein n=1 Tax=Dissostichus mawsoni TaxID=36200 RepID=A0A7J5XYT0_DISMA|nr:hypothetical protein F7725_024246 [Dissostichus mawsoni]
MALLCTATCVHSSNTNSAAVSPCVARQLQPTRSPENYKMMDLVAMATDAVLPRAWRRDKALKWTWEVRRRVPRCPDTVVKGALSHRQEDIAWPPIFYCGGTLNVTTNAPQLLRGQACKTTGG